VWCDTWRVALASQQEQRGERPTGEGFALVERNASQPCCGSCVSEQEAGYGDYADYCCCVHGTLYGYRWPKLTDKIRWTWDGAEREWNALAD
jgi:hypothetical protein